MAPQAPRAVGAQTTVTLLKTHLSHTTRVARAQPLLPLPPASQSRLPSRCRACETPQTPVLPIRRYPYEGRPDGAMVVTRLTGHDNESQRWFDMRSISSPEACCLLQLVNAPGCGKTSALATLLAEAAGGDPLSVGQRVVVPFSCGPP